MAEQGRKSYDVVDASAVGKPVAAEVTKPVVMDKPMDKPMEPVMENAPQSKKPATVPAEQQHLAAILDHVDSIGKIALNLPNSAELAEFLVHLNKAKNAFVALEAKVWEYLTEVMQKEEDV